MIITISGTPGSGKSTVAQKLAELWGWERIYVGGIRRSIARKKNMTLEQLNEYAKTHPETDVDVDKEAAGKARELQKRGKNVIVEGRVQYHFLPDSFKLYLKVEPEEAARRIWKDLQEQTAKEQRNEGEFTSVAQLKKSLIEREKKDSNRYKKYYGINHLDESNYDYVLDTTALTPEQVIKKIIRAIRQRLCGKSRRHGQDGA